MAEIGIGQLGLMPEEFWSMTFRDFKYKLDAYNTNEQTKWARTRLLCSYMIQPHLKKNAKVDLKDIIYLPHFDDRKQQSKKVTKEEKERARKLAEKWKNK